MMHLRAAALAAAILVAASPLGFVPAYAQQADAPDDGAKPEYARRVDHDTVSKASEDDIARESENPIGNLTIVPFQSYTNFGFGPHNGTQEVLEIEPVVPVHINSDWTIINRAIFPIVWNPSLSPAPSVPQAIAPTNYSAFLSPSHSVDGWTWGVGPIVQIPTATSLTVGSNVWGLGPTAVVVKTTEHVVAGVLVNDISSLGGTSGPGGNRYATFLLEPFFNYNLSDGWFLNTAPLITADWDMPGRKWQVPIGGEIGRIVRIGKLPVKFDVGAYYNVATPQYGARRSLKTLVAFIF